MQTYKFMKSSVILVSFGVLAACGGGGGNGGDAVVDAPSFGDVESTANSALAAVILDSSNNSVTADTGRLDRTAGTGSLGGLSGQLSDDRTQIDLPNGRVSFDAAEDAFSARFTVAAGDTNTLGIVGIATSAADLPSGTATYAGDTILTATSGTDLFDLTGTATVTAEFGASSPTVTTALTDLAGTQEVEGGTSAPETVADAGSLTISGSAISGAAFSGGSAELTSDVLALSGDADVNVEGSFYGPDGSEVGGVFIIDDGDTKIFGDFLAD